MDLDAVQHLIMKAIIEPIDSLASLGLVQNRPHGGRSFEDNAMVFYEKDK